MHQAFPAVTVLMSMLIDVSASWKQIMSANDLAAAA